MPMQKTLNILIVLFILQPAAYIHAPMYVCVCKGDANAMQRYAFLGTDPTGKYTSFGQKIIRAKN